MKNQNKIMSCLKTMVVVIAVMAFCSLPVLAQGGNTFSQNTVAKRYNFNFSGQGSDGNTIVAVGWFEVNDAGNIIDARAQTQSENVNLGLVFGGLDPNSSSLWKLRPIEGTSGMYDLDFNIVDNLDQNMRFFGTILLDDTHGRRGRLAGRYSYRVSFPFEDQGAGVLRGEINAQ